MGITYPVKIVDISKDEYHQIDHIVMGLAFDVYNEFGRLNNEKIYQNELLFRCRKCGFDVMSETAIIVEYKDFVKKYYIDLIINNSIIYELKTAEKIIPRYKSQVLHYLMLTGCHYGKLINFRSGSVEYEYVTTNVSSDNRYQYSIDVKRWQVVNNESKDLELILYELIKEWGVYLDVRLYEDAIINFMGGEEKVLRPVLIEKDDRVLGSQKVNMLSSDTAFVITSLINDIQGYYSHLKRFIKHANINIIQWVNFNRQEVSLITITK